MGQFGPSIIRSLHQWMQDKSKEQTDVAAGLVFPAHGCSLSQEVLVLCTSLRKITCATETSM